MPPPPAEFSDSEEDPEEEELHPEEQDGDDVGDMVVMEGEEDLDDDGLGKSYLVLRPGQLFRVTLRDLHMPMHSFRKLLESEPHFGSSRCPAPTGGTNT